MKQHRILDYDKDVDLAVLGSTKLYLKIAIGRTNCPASRLMGGF